MLEIRTTPKNHILRVQINRPQKKNALTPAKYDERLRIAAAARATHRVDQRLEAVEGLLGEI